MIIDMKLLVIHGEKEKKPAEKLKSFLNKTGIQVEIFPIKNLPESGRNEEKLFTALFKKSDLELGVSPSVPTHIGIISALVPCWVDFLAGFSCGSKVQLFVHGQKAVESIPDVFKFCFKLLYTAEELHEYLLAEYEIHERIDADKGRNTAKDALLGMGIPVNDKALVHCVNEGNLREVLFFLAAGFSPNTNSITGVPLLNIAARNGNREIVRFLFLAGAKLDTQSGDRGTSALIDCVMAGHYDLMMDLLKAGTDVNIQSKDGQTALLVATGAGDIEMTEALLKAGANPDIQDTLEMSARKYASLLHKNTLLPLFNKYSPQKEV